MALFDADMLLLLLDPTLPAPKDEETGIPVSDVKERLEHLVNTLHEERKKIIIPTPALSEVLIHTDGAGTDYLAKIQNSAAFKIEPFDTRAAVELARMTALALNEGDKKGGCSAPWNKIKFDRQIVAIAKISNVSMIYSNDKGLKTFARANVKSGVQALNQAAT